MKTKKLIDRNNAFDIINVSFMLILIFITVYPFWYSFIGSISQGADYMKGDIYFWPRIVSLENYRTVFTRNEILNAYGITVARTAIGIVTHVFFAAIFTYGFSRKFLKGRNIYAIIGLITLYFNGGLIPTYLLYSWLGLIDNFNVYVLPPLFAFYPVLIIQAFYRGIPEEISESALIDGASEYKIFFKLILPLSKPVLAVMALFNGVFHWNSYRDAMIFTQSPSLQTVQVYLMKIIKLSEYASKMALDSGAQSFIGEDVLKNSETIKLATMMIATIPILVLYPYLQKYFVKGVMIGSVKG